jgi:hypothetical protein
MHAEIDEEIDVRLKEAQGRLNTLAHALLRKFLEGVPSKRAGAHRCL